MRSVWGLSVVGALLLVCLSLPSLAQTITGTISGDVTDTSGAVVAGATVTVENLGTAEKRTATTTASGSFRVPDLAIGKYKVTATAEGFKTLVQTSEVLTGAVTRAEFKLPIGQRTETVEVQGSAPLIDLSPNNNNYVDSEKIENVPINGRDFNSLLAITPGVQRAPGGGFLAISINGSRTTSNNYFIDGMYNNDRYYGDSAINQTGILGIPAVTFPPDAIEELSVQETPSSEFGVKGGAPILLSMKSGTNTWHGGGTWVNHSGIGDADNYFANHNTDNCAGAGECRPTPIHNNQFHANIGGPIIKDKMFFFLFYEGQRNKSVAIKGRSVPTPQQISDAETDIANNGLQVDPVGLALLNYFPTSPTGTIVQQTPSTASNNEFGVKWDYKFSPKNSLAVRYIFGDSFQNGPPFAGLPPNSAYPQNLFNSIAPSRAQMAGISWIWNLSSTKILESRFGYTRFSQLIDVNNKVNPQTIGQSIDPNSLGIDTGPLGPADFGVPYVYMYHLGYGGYIGGVQGYPLTTRPDATYDWSEHFSWVKGNHTIKLGGNFQRATTNSIRNNARTGITVGYFTSYAGYMHPSDVTHVTDDIEQLLLGKADNADREFGDTHRHITQNSIGFYAQDDWKIKPRLTLNFGLRYEVNGTLRDKNNLEANFFPPPNARFVQVGKGISGAYNVDYRDLGPHVGFSWDVWGNGKTAVRGGYSLSYDVANFGALASPYSFAHAHAGMFTQPSMGNVSVANLADVASGVGNLPPNDPKSTCYAPNARAGDYICFDAKVNGTLFAVNPPVVNAFSVVQNFKTPRYHNFNLSVQDELFRNNVVTVAYSGQRGKDLVIYHDLNASPLGSPCSGSDCGPFRPYAGLFTPELQHVIQASNQGYSQYDSLQASFNQRAWRGLDTQYNLTWSKCYDLNSVNRGGQGDYPQINNDGTGHPNFRDGWGLCDHDVRLNFNIGGVYALPSIHALGSRLGSGWELSTIFTAISGRPFSVFKNGGSDPSGQGLTGSAIRAAYDGSRIHYNTRNPDAYVVENFTVEDQLDPCGRQGSPDPNKPRHFLGGQALSPFFVACSGTVGNSRRNMLTGPGLSQWDMSLMKKTKINERVSFELRWEVYNVLNRANFALSSINNTAGSAFFGTLSQTPDVSAGNPVIAQGGPRNMNLALKIIF
jgi:hypothetical protein